MPTSITLATTMFPLFFYLQFFKGLTRNNNCFISDDSLYIFGNNCVIVGVCLEVPDLSINFFVILINFHFAQASMIIKVDNKGKKTTFE